VTLQRLALWLLTVLLLLSAAALSLLFFASRSESVLRWGVETFASRLPCRLTLDGLRGAITEPLQIDFVACENDDYRIEARGVMLVWSPWLLRRQRLEISELRVSSLAYIDKQPVAGETAPPDDLSLPIEVHVASLEIGSVSIAGAGQPVSLRNLHAAFFGDARSHQLTLQGVQTDWGDASGELTLGALAPLPVQARLRVDSAYVEGWPIAAIVDVAGPLARMTVSADGTAGALPFAARADLAPFSETMLGELRASSAAVDLSAFDARLPETALSVDISARMRDDDTFEGEISVANPQPGALDSDRLPLKALQARYRAGADGVALDDASFDLGAAGTAEGRLGYRDGLLRLDVDVRRLDLRAMQGNLRATRLNGNVRVEGNEQRQRIAARLREADLSFEGEAIVEGQHIRVERLLARTGGAQANVSGRIDLNDAVAFSLNAELRRFDPARFGDFPKADINGTVQARGFLRPQWQVALDYRLARSRYLGQALGGDGSLVIAPDRVRDASVRLTLGPNAIKLEGGFGAVGDTLRFDLRAPALAVFQQGISGSLQASGTFSGTRARPALDARFTAERLEWEGLGIARWQGEARLEQGEDPRLALRWQVDGAARGDLAFESIRVIADGTLSAHRIALSARGDPIDASAQLEGGFDRKSATWRGTLARFDNAGEYAFSMLQAAAVELAADRALLAATRVRFSNTDIVLGDTAYRGGTLSTSGSVGGVRLSRLLALLDSPPRLESTLVLGARWSLRAGETLDGTLEVLREGGDIVIPGEEPLAMGLTQTALSVRATANRLDARLAISGARLSAQGSAQTVAERRGAAWGIAGNAPLKADVRAEWKSVRALVALLAGDALTGDGSLALNVKADGTLAQPRVSGALTGEKLRFEQVASGVFFREGTLKATFGDDGVTVREFRIRGGDGVFSANGRLATLQGRPQVDAAWSAQNLTVVQHPDLRLAVSGKGTLKADEQRIALAGELTADRGRVELRSQTAPALGGDVVVAGGKPRVSVTERALKSELDLKLDLGPDFRISGRGLDARLSGSLRLTSPGDSPLSARGEIRVAEGSYAAYDRKLNIDEGVFYFSGPVDNPGLLIRALRKNQAVEAGVEVSGTARDPRVRLVSSPEVPDPEKLSWLVLGRPVETGSTQDAQALQASAVALAAGLGTAPLQRQLAGAVGLDELRLGVSSDGTQGGVVAIGKQVSDKIYVSSEQSLSTATNTLRISYQLSRRWSLRTESGVTDAVDLFYTISFD
jgi:translocation and assembly module TamB